MALPLPTNHDDDERYKRTVLSCTGAYRAEGSDATLADLWTPSLTYEPISLLLPAKTETSETRMDSRTVLAPLVPPCSYDSALHQHVPLTL